MHLPLESHIMATAACPCSNPLLTADVVTTAGDVMMTAYTKKTPVVRFAPMVSVSPSLCIPPLDVSRVWYNSNDLAGFKRSAKEAAAAFFDRGGRNSSSVLLLRDDGSCSGENDDDDDHRGIECCSYGRQRQRFLAIRCTLSAHRRGMGADETAKVSQRCTAWNAQVAFVQACHDYATVYQPNLSHMIPPVHAEPPAFPYGCGGSRCPATTRSSKTRTTSMPPTAAAPKKRVAGTAFSGTGDVFGNAAIADVGRRIRRRTV
jgi:hypothetical protein